MSMLKAYPPEEARRLIEAAIQADPTSGHIYVTWVLCEFRTEVIRLPEDAPAVRDLLTQWEQLKATDTFTGDRDINRHGYYGLRRLVERAPLRKSLRQQERQRKQQGVETVYEQGRYRIVQVTSPTAAAALARGTLWCTRHSEDAATYLKAGALYLVFRNGVRFAQIHLLAGEIKDERDATVVPDAELAGALERFFQPTTVADIVGLSLILARSLLTPKQERALLRWWSAGYDPDEFCEELPLKSAWRYLHERCRRGWLRSMVRETLAKGRFDLAWQLDVADLQKMDELSRPLRRAIQRCIAAQKFRSLDGLLRHFQGTNLLETNLSGLADDMIEFLWKLFQVASASDQMLVSATRTDENITRDRSRRDFMALYEELERVRRSRRRWSRTSVWPTNNSRRRTLLLAE